MGYVGHLRRPVDSLRNLLAGSEEVFAGVAYISRAGVHLMDKELQELKKRGGKLSVLTTLDFGHTDPRALDRLVELGAEVRLRAGGGGTFHPKVYLGRGAGGPQVLMGSANLSSRALLSRNVEAGIEVRGQAAEALHQAATVHLGALWDAGGTTSYVLGTEAPVRYSMPQPSTPSMAAEGESRSTFPGIWAAVELLCAERQEVRTVQGKSNRLLAFDRTSGVLVGTGKSKDGEWVPPWMFEVTVEAVAARGRLRLNPDCTTDLRIHRSSAVFAILGALPFFSLRARPAVLVWRGA